MMCDPISIGLTVAGTALQAYGSSQVAGAQKRDIAKSGQDYEAERTRQAGFNSQNSKTVSDTLGLYSPQAMGQRTADATATRQTAYVNPLTGHNFSAVNPADYDANNAVASRNAATGAHEQGKAISSALAKAKLDAYGDAQTGANIASNNNANQIDTTNRIARGSEQAEQVNQGTLDSKMQADHSAGSFAGGLGDLFTMAGSLGAMSPGGFSGLGSKLFGGSIAPFSNSFAGITASTPMVNGPGIFGMRI